MFRPTLARGLRVASVMLCLSSASVLVAHAQQPAAGDNTKANTRDRKPSQVTADQQKNNTTDLDLTQDGKVTLKGPVRSEDEKKIVEAKAADIAGATNVTNQVSVAPKAQTHRTPSTK